MKLSEFYNHMKDVLNFFELRFCDMELVEIKIVSSNTIQFKYGNVTIQRIIDNG